MKYRRWHQAVAVAMFATAQFATAATQPLPGPGWVRAGVKHGFARRRPVGLGPVVRSKLGGQIFGWDINESGTDGVLAESVLNQPSGFTSAVETFDQTTGKVTKVVAKQHSSSGNRELIVSAIVANDVGLIDDERVTRDGRNDLYYLMAPVTGARFTGEWNLPNDHDLLIQSIADQ
jgi:hypothetical protein